MYWPPAGGVGVQRPLKFATHLPALGIETHVLAPGDPKWIHRDEELQAPTQAWVHRARYVGPRGRLPAEELHGARALERAAKMAMLTYRRVLVPDENVTWNATAIPAAIRIVRAEKIDAIVTTSPPSSVHLIGAAVKRATGVRWIADVRDSMTRNADRRVESMAVRAKEKTQSAVARLIARYADASVAVTDFIADELRAFEPKGAVAVIPNGADFDEFAGLQHHASDRFRITHTGAFFGKRDPRPFLTAFGRADLPDAVARFVGDFRATDREWAQGLDLGNRLELHPYVPRRRRALGEGVRVPRSRAADPRRRAAGRGGRGPRARGRRRRRRPARRRGRDRGRAARLAHALACGRAERHAARAGAPGAARPPRTRRRPRATAAEPSVTRFLFLATVFCVTFEKVHWSVGGTVTLADVLTILFLASFALDRLAFDDWRVTRTAALAIALAGAFLAVYLAGFFNVETLQGLNQFAKGLVKFALHFGFLAAGVAYLARHSRDFAFRAFGVFVAGMAANAGYGLVQLLTARAGVNLDAHLLSPLTRGASQINVYGSVGGTESVYRVNALTGDPNHLAIMLLVPLLSVTPVYLRTRRPWLGALLAGLLLVELATLSRSGLLGLGVGVLVLFAQYRTEFLSRALAIPDRKSTR